MPKVARCPKQHSAYMDTALPCYAEPSARISRCVLPFLRFCGVMGIKLTGMNWTQHRRFSVMYFVWISHLKALICPLVIIW